MRMRNNFAANFESLPEVFRQASQTSLLTNIYRTFAKTTHSLASPVLGTDASRVRTVGCKVTGHSSICHESPALKF